MIAQSDEITRASEPAETGSQDDAQDWLRLASKLAVAVGLVGIPWTYMQPNGWGPPFSFVCFFVALMLRFAASSR